MKHKKNRKVKFEVVDIPSKSKRYAPYYEEVIDKLITVGAHNALKVDFKDFCKEASTFGAGLRQAAKRKKIAISIMPNEDHITVWKKVQV